jgi:hypothetical protein
MWQPERAYAAELGREPLAASGDVFRIGVNLKDVGDGEDLHELASKAAGHHAARAETQARVFTVSQER